MLIRKTQTSARKTSFKGIVNLQNEKLPQKKSRSRSIRDRNTTTNQHAYSRTTQNDNKSFNQTREKNYNTNRKNNNDILNRSEFKEDRTNLSRNQNSIQKVRQNLRKQSQQIKQKQRNRSSSRRKRSQNRNKQNSISHHVNRFRNAIPRNTSPSHNQIVTRSNQKDLLSQIIKLKSHLNTIEKSYSAIRGQLGSFGGDLNTNNMSMPNEQQELKQKANDLNNILESFHIRFKQNINKTTQELLDKIDQCEARLTINKENVQNNQNRKQHQDEDQSSIKTDAVFNSIEKQFGIRQYIGSSNSLFQRMNNDVKNTFSDLQKRLLLTQERLLK